MVYPYTMPQPGVGVAPSVPVNPGTGVARPAAPATPAAGGFRGRMDSLLQDPAIAMTLMRLGGSLMQPTPPGQSHLGQFGTGLQDAASYFVALQDRQRRQDALDMKAKREEESLGLEKEQLGIQRTQAEAEREHQEGMRGLKKQEMADTARYRDQQTTLEATQNRMAAQLKQQEMELEAQRFTADLGLKGSEAQRLAWQDAVEQSRNIALDAGVEWDIREAYKIFNANMPMAQKKFAPLTQEQITEAGRQIAAGERTFGDLQSASRELISPDDMGAIRGEAERIAGELAAEAERPSGIVRARAEGATQQRGRGAAGQRRRAAQAAREQELANVDTMPIEQVWDMLTDGERRVLTRIRGRETPERWEASIRRMAKAGIKRRRM